MKHLAIMLTALLGIVACTNEDGARRALHGAGYTNIELKGHAFFGCSDDDHSCTKFEAVGPRGDVVTGQVGCGLIGKGCTIRTD